MEELSADGTAKIAQDVKAFDGKGNIYFTLNPVNPDLLARAANRLKYSVETTTRLNGFNFDSHPRPNGGEMRESV